MPVTVKWPSKP